MGSKLLRVPAATDRAWRRSYAAALHLQSSRLYLLLEGRCKRQRHAQEAVCNRDLGVWFAHAFTEACHTSNHVCVGERAGQHITARLLTKLAQLFDTAAAEGPVQNIIPLLPSVGWSSGALGPSPH